MRSARADLSIFHHDGRRWSELRNAAFSHTIDVPQAAHSPSWGDILRAVAGVAAEHAEMLASGEKVLAELARPVLPFPEAGHGVTANRGECLQ